MGVKLGLIGWQTLLDAAGASASAFDDSKPVSVNVKLDRWFPKMTGARMNKQGGLWREFNQLCQLRNKAAVHLATDSYTISPSQKNIFDSYSVRSAAVYLLEF